MDIKGTVISDVHFSEEYIHFEQKRISCHNRDVLTLHGKVITRIGDYIGFLYRDLGYTTWHTGYRLKEIIGDIEEINSDDLDVVKAEVTRRQVAQRIRTIHQRKPRQCHDTM